MKNKWIITLVCSLVSVLLVVATVFMLVSDNNDEDVIEEPVVTKTSVDKEYEYNKEIQTNPNAPDEKEVKVESIKGFTEDKEQKFLNLPVSMDAKVGNSNINIIDIIAVGKYTGPNVDGTGEEIKDCLAIVVNNPSDKVLSIASISVEYADNKSCSFSPSNILPKQSAIILPSNSVVKYSDVEKFDCILDYAVPQDKLPFIEDKVGVDFKNGQCIVTNHSSEYLGDVYVRYKKIAGGNAYLGAVTYSLVIEDLNAYETKIVDAPDFNEETCVVISVENYIS